MHPVKITTLGNLIIYRDGQVLEDFVSTKTSLLLIYLAMNAGEHSREKLASLLWSDTSDEQALKNLRTVLSSLRQNLPDVLDVQRKTVSIAAHATVWVDAVAFEQGFNEKRESPPEQLNGMIELTRLYQGDFLAGIRIKQAEAFDEWVYGKQQHLADTYHTLLFNIVDHTLKHKKYDIGLQYARQLISLDPYWEAAHRHYMCLLFYTNHANDALRHYEQFAQMLEDELETAPAAETKKLYEEIRSGEMKKAKTRLMMALPQTLFIEPTTDVEYAQRMLNTPECRLLTVLGISGVGKTTFAQHVAFHRQHLYRDGACVVPLSEAQSEAEIPLFIARALDLDVNTNPKQDNLQQAVIDCLKPLNGLLVLDNYEHLLPEVSFIQALLEAAPEMQLLVTSQVQLNLYREWLLPLKGLGIPDSTTDDPLNCGTVQLFALTAQRINPAFNVEDALDDVVQICQIMDGLPLAIVIAAGWVQYMSPAEILDMVRGNVMEIRTVHRDLPPRHQNFKSLLDSVLKYLSPQEEQALVSVSIFNGSFDRRAALAVTGVSMDLFISLIDKSLIQQLDGFRYTLHSLVRQVLQDRLRQSPYYEDVIERYTGYFQKWCRDLYNRNLPLHEVLRVIDTEYHHLLWMEHPAEIDLQRYFLAIAPALSEYWASRVYHHHALLDILEAGIYNRGISEDYRAWGVAEFLFLSLTAGQHERIDRVKDEALRLAHNAQIPYVLARVLRSLVELAALRGDYDGAQSYLKEITDLGDIHAGTKDPRFEVLLTAAYGELGVILMDQAQYEEAKIYLRNAQRHWEATGDVLRAALVKSNLGVIALKQKDYALALRLFEDCLKIARDVNHDVFTIIFTANMGEAAMYLHQYQDARGAFVDALKIAERIGRNTSILNVLDQFAQLSIFSRQYDQAAQIMGFVNALREKVNLPIALRDLDEYDQRQALLKRHLPETYDSLFNTGSHMTLGTIVQIVCNADYTPQADP